MSRDSLMLNALEDIYAVANTRQTLSSAVELTNIVLRIQDIAQQALKRLELGGHHVE